MDQPFVQFLACTFVQSLDYTNVQGKASAYLALALLEIVIDET